MNLDHDFFQVSKLSEDQKKVFTKNGTLFSSNSRGDLRSDVHQSQIIGGDADENHTQIIGGDTVKLLGRIQSNYWGDISPPGFGTPAGDGNRQIVILKTKIKPARINAAINCHEHIL